jgi:hypothetical protein
MPNLYEKMHYIDGHKDWLNQWECSDCGAVWNKEIPFCVACGSKNFKQIMKDGNETKQLLIKKYLENPDLLNLIDLELDKKIVGENESRKVIFLIANMRNVSNLNKGSDNLIVNALSGTGKDHVVGAVFDLIPGDEKEELLRTTPKVLAYTRNRKISEAKK